MNEQKGIVINTAFINPSLYDSRVIDKIKDWRCIVKAMQEIECIFAIPPVILTQYIRKEILFKEQLYQLINPLNTNVDPKELEGYIIELGRIGLNSTLFKYQHYLYTQYT